MAIVTNDKVAIARDPGQSYHCYLSQPPIFSLEIFLPMNVLLVAIPFIPPRKSSIPQGKVLSSMDHSIVMVSYTASRNPLMREAMT